ncbi:hybrid sensor histidine kinase/response regulator [Paraglaciecola chathamensis]|uniref:histidine kinase n=1 Tax=Paraglaciecola agarilytica NO2 TaxID=1125747 RepID=A0ABQ0I5X9_9ALTE|nr:NahK/ErcS family hybrid sensor histidine kinase/response regulator [Paraglaciecola agarilytica]GAC04771.1 fused sensor protein/response regulator [Paraglaciecola agarilytica NO2]
MSEQELLQEIAQLRAENTKLRKINDALISRVEQGGGNQYAPYAAFEHSVHLAEQVREKTQILNETLAEVEYSHRALKQANEDANIFKQRFIDAIESISEAFVLLDSDGLILLQNSNFATFWGKTGLSIQEGANFNDLKDRAKSSGMIRRASPGGEQSSPVYQLADGRWFQLNERRTSEGGWVMLYTDITDIKVAETARYEQGMIQKSMLLQGLIDNLSQGVVMISSSNQIEVWNNRFVQMSQLSPNQLRSMPYFQHLTNLTELELSERPRNKDGYYVQTLSNGTVLEIRDHRLINGKLIKTYTDITVRHRYAESLEKNERWLRLITDNVPAMIAYIGSDLKFQFTNQVYVDWYGWPQGSLDGESIKDSRVDSDYSQLRPYIERALKGESLSFEIAENNHVGEARYLLKSYVPNRNSEGHVQGFFVLVRDITERKRNAVALQKAHDQLEIRVAERTSQLKNLNDELLIEAEERRIAQVNLTNAKREAEFANISKTKFLAAVSHDLLQPLNAAQLFTSSLADTLINTESFPVVNSLTNSLDDLENLISTLIDISKLDAGVVKADKGIFKLSELLDNLANEYQQATSQYNIELRYVPSHIMVYSDSVLLARILRNFMSNAFRYAAKGKVLLGCRRRGEHVTLEVWDTGSGIAQNQLSEIFKEFKRLKSSQSAFGNGLGLGLAIVDKIASVLGHKINVHSELGKGSVFSVSVPIAATLEPLKPLTSTQFAVNPTDFSNYRIWLVDNDISVCEGMSRLLAGWGCKIITAVSLNELKDKVDIAYDKVDILMVDYHLNDGELGLDVAQHINQIRRTALPTIMITANYSQSLKNEIKNSKILLLNKPVKPMKLKTSMLYLLRKA